MLKPKTRKKAAPVCKPVLPVAVEEPAPLLVRFDRDTLTGMMLLKGVPYYFRALMDDDQFLGFRLYRQDGQRVKQIDVTEYGNSHECDCEAMTYRRDAAYQCKHILALVSFGLLAQTEVAHV